MTPQSPAARTLCVVLLLLASLACGEARASSNEDLHAMFDAPCERYNVPKPLALAIARKESAMEPWIMNIEGRTVRSASREDAMALSRAALRAGLSFDIGVMQVNSQWLRRYNLPLDLVFDPRGNVQVGVWILAQGIKRYGLTWQAVAAYHTPNTDSARGRAYAEDVIRRLGATSRTSGNRTSSESRAVERPTDKVAAASPLVVKRCRATDTQQ